MFNAEKYMSPEALAEVKGVSRQSVYNLLQNEERRLEMLPGAIKVGEGRRGVWYIPRDEGQAWEPRTYPRNVRYTESSE